MVRCGAAELVVDLLTSSECGNDIVGDKGGKDKGEGTGAYSIKSSDGGGNNNVNTAFVKQEALRFACTILEGGSKFVQDKFYHYMLNHSVAASKFFSGIYGSILQATRCATSIQTSMELQLAAKEEGHQAEKQNEKINANKANRMSDEDHGIKELFQVKDELNVGLIFRMLQLLAEGHNLKMQRLMQDQTSTIGLSRSRNLVLAGSNLLTNLCFSTGVLKKMHITALDEITQLFNFLNECVQGPCHENQELLANTSISETVCIECFCGGVEGMRLIGEHTHVGPMYPFVVLSSSLHSECYICFLLTNSLPIPLPCPLLLRWKSPSNTPIPKPMQLVKFSPLVVPSPSPVPSAPKSIHYSTRT